MLESRLLSGSMRVGALIFVVSLVGAGCTVQPSHDASGTVAQSIVEDGDDGDVGEPVPLPEETPLTDENLAAMDAGNAEVAAGIAALDGQSAAAVTCEMELTCDAGTPGPVGTPVPVGEPRSVGEPGSAGASSVVAAAAEVVEADVVCGTVTSTAATIAGLLAGIQATDALIGNARLAVNAAKDRLRGELRGGSADSQDDARIALINAETRLTVLQIQKGSLLPALAALLADPCSLAAKRAVAHANADIAQANYEAAQRVRAILESKYNRKVARRAAQPRDIPASDVAAAKQAFDAAVTNERAAKAAYDAAIAALTAILLGP